MKATFSLRRMSLIEAAVYIGLALGSITASFLFPSTNATTVFVVSSCSILVATLYIAIFVKESISRENKAINPSGAISVLKSSFKNRKSYDRLILWLLIIIYVINVIVIGKFVYFVAVWWKNLNLQTDVKLHPLKVIYFTWILKCNVIQKQEY